MHGVEQWPIRTSRLNGHCFIYIGECIAWQLLRERKTDAAVALRNSSNWQMPSARASSVNRAPLSVRKRSHCVRGHRYKTARNNAARCTEWDAFDDLSIGAQFFRSPPNVIAPPLFADAPHWFSHYFHKNSGLTEKAKRDQKACS